MNAITAIASNARKIVGLFNRRTELCDVTINGGDIPGDVDLVLKITDRILGKQLTVVFDGTNEYFVAIRPVDSSGKMQSVRIDREALVILQKTLNEHLGLETVA